VQEAENRLLAVLRPLQQAAEAVLCWIRRFSGNDKDRWIGGIG